MALSGQVAAPARGLHTVVARMRALDAAWPADDGLAVFNRVYLSVTETIGQRLAQGAFADPGTAVTLDTRFAARYLSVAETADGPGAQPACWRPLLLRRRDPGVRPLQFAVAGINAHIGHDLALAVVDTCRSLGCDPRDMEDEFDLVGDLLAALEERVREDLMPGPDLLEAAEPLTHLIGSWSLERARAAAWSTARALWALRRLPCAAEEFAQRLDGLVGFAGRVLLTPLPHRSPVPAS